VILDEATVARDLLLAARTLAERPVGNSAALWPGAAVLLARQALEVAVKTYWSAKAPGAEGAPMTAALLCLGPWLGDESIGRRALYVWSALSRASHYHPYELPPTSGELAAWCDTVAAVIEATEKAWA
jgi:hypothetical protein